MNDTHKKFVSLISVSSFFVYSNSKIFDSLIKHAECLARINIHNFVFRCVLVGDFVWKLFCIRATSRVRREVSKRILTYHIIESQICETSWKKKIIVTRGTYFVLQKKKKEKKNSN